MSLGRMGGVYAALHADHTATTASAMLAGRD
jgi:hypothetical protein